MKEEEEATLWDFGGGIDPAAADQRLEDDARARPGLIKLGGGSDSFLDLGVPLEQKFLKLIDPMLFESGADRHRLRLESKTANWCDAMYIRAEPTEENERSDYKVRWVKDKWAVKIPRAWLRNPKVQGIDNPFHTAVNRDHVVVRYLPEGAIEIYPKAVYNAHPTFDRVPAAAPVVIVPAADAQEREHINLAQYTAYPGDVFDIAIVEEESLKAAWEDVLGDAGTYKRPKPAEFHHVHTQGDLDFHSRDRLKIEWMTNRWDEMIGVWDYVVRFQIIIEYTGPFRITVPAQGRMTFQAAPDGHADGQAITHRRMKSFDRDELPHRRELPGNMSSADGRLTRFISSLFRGSRQHPSETERISPIHINRDWSASFFDVPADGPPVLYVPRWTPD